MKNVDMGRILFHSLLIVCCPAFPAVRVGALFKIPPFSLSVKLTFAGNWNIFYRSDR